jgi:hypothetical protein
MSANANHLWFHKTQVLEALRVEGSIPSAIGFDLPRRRSTGPSSRRTWSSACPARCFSRRRVQGPVRNFDRDKRYISVLFNAILTY